MSLVLYHCATWAEHFTAGAWTNLSWQDEPWAEFSTLEVAACHAMHLLHSIAIWSNLELKTRPKQLLGSLPLDIALPGWGQISLLVFTREYIYKMHKRATTAYFSTIVSYSHKMFTKFAPSSWETNPSSAENSKTKKEKIIFAQSHKTFSFFFKAI